MDLLQIIYYTGLFVFAISGALKARTYAMDIFGAGVLAFATAYGGGTIRDIILGRRINWLNDYVALALVSVALLSVYLLKSNINKFRKFIFFTDAIGLGLFTVIGIEISLSNGANELYSIILGTITAAFGGFLADILSSQAPDLLKKGELYATASLIGGSLFILMSKIGLPDNLNLLACVVVTIALRILTKKRVLRMPKI